MSLITRNFTVNNKVIGNSTLWELYTSGSAVAIIRLYTQDINTDWLKDDIKQTYNIATETLNSNNNTFNLNWTYDTEVFSKGYTVYVSYAFIVNNEVCAIGAGDDFDCYSMKKNDNTLTPVNESDPNTSNEAKQASALYRQWYQIANLNSIFNNLENQHPVIEIGENRVIQMNDNENIIIQFDNDSELITFRAKRKYDGIDLFDKTLYFYGITPGGKHPIKDLVTVEIDESNEEYIIISWKVTNAFADGYGEMDFAIIAEGENILDEYLWQTHPAKMTIHPSILNNEVEFKALSWNEWQEALINQINQLTTAYENGEIKWQSMSSLLTK